MRRTRVKREKGTEKETERERERENERNGDRKNERLTAGRVTTMILCFLFIFFLVRLWKRTRTSEERWVTRAAPRGSSPGDAATAAAAAARNTCPAWAPCGFRGRSRSVH